MEICFCFVCTSRIPADAFASGAAIHTDEGRHYCATCAPKAAAKATQTVGKVPSGNFSPVRESGQNSSVTRFYFCETCNKRITDKQILEGLARDKKMKGIYCNECSVGVTTMEFDAITEPEPPRKNVRQSGGNVRQSGGHATRIGTPPPRSSTANITPVKRQDAQPVKSSAHVGGPAKPQSLVFAGVVIAVLILAAIAPRVLRSGTTPKQDALKNGSEVALVHDNAPAQPTPPLPFAKGQSDSTPILPGELAPTAAKIESDPKRGTTPPSPPVELVAAPIIDTPVIEKTAVEKPSPVALPPDTTPEPKIKAAAPVQPSAMASATTNPTANAELLGKVLRMLGQRQIADAIALVRENKDGSEASRQELATALDAIQKEDAEFQKSLTALIGKRIKVQTTKEIAEGTLKTLDYPVLRIEKSIAIDGQAMGSTLVVINATDINEASRAAIYRPDADGASATSRALLAMSSQRIEEAQAVVPQIKEPGLRDVLAAELRRQQDADTETRAQAAWTAITAHAKDANTLTRAKQMQTDLNAFEKAFGYSEFGQTPAVAAALVELKERMSRIAMGLDPRLQSLFKGRIASYDAANCILTLEYDLMTKDQTSDFIGSTWAPPGDHTGLTWAKGKLSTFCKYPLNKILQMPQFVSSTVNFQIDYSNPRCSAGNSQIDFGFMDEKALNVLIRCDRKCCTVLENDKTAGSAPTDFLALKQAHLEIACRDKAISVKFNGASVLDCNLSKSPKNAGIWFGGGWDSGVTVTKMRVSGQLDPAWLTTALKSAK